MSQIIGNTSQYTDEDRRRVATLYCIHGNMKAVSRLAGIPRETIRDWQKREWWEPLITSIRQETNDIIQAGWTRIAQSALAEIEDRIEHGDERLVGAEKVRVRVSARDLGTIAGISTDKTMLLQGKPTSISGQSQELQGKIRALERFAEEHIARERKTIDMGPIETGGGGQNLEG